MDALTKGFLSRMQSGALAASAKESAPAFQGEDVPEVKLYGKPSKLNAVEGVQSPAGQAVSESFSKRTVYRFNGKEQFVGLSQLAHTHADQMLAGKNFKLDDKRQYEEVKCRTGCILIKEEKAIQTLEKLRIWGEG